MLKNQKNGENIEKSKEVKSNNNSIKKARINNVLAEANKSILNKVTVDFANINDYLSNKKYNNYVNLLNESTIVVASPSHLLFSFGDKANISVFDNNLEEIQRFLTEILGNNYKIAAVTEKEWLDIKNEFIYKKNNNIKYSLIDENDVKLEIRDNNNKKAKKNGNPNDIFGESLISIE